MPIFFILFIVIPVVEIFLLIKVGQIIGGWSTVGLVLLSAFIGVNMLRYQGLSTLSRAKQRMDKGELPLGEMRDGIVIAVGGALLITPGFVTDFLGFCCLIPYTRRWFVSLFSSVFQTVIRQKGAHAQFYYSSDRSTYSNDSAGRDDIIEGEYTDLDEKQGAADDDQNKRIR